MQALPTYKKRAGIPQRRAPCTPSPAHRKRESFKNEHSAQPTNSSEHALLPEVRGPAHSSSTQPHASAPPRESPAPSSHHEQPSLPTGLHNTTSNMTFQTPPNPHDSEHALLPERPRTAANIWQWWAHLRRGLLPSAVTMRSLPLPTGNTTEPQTGPPTPH